MREDTSASEAIKLLEDERTSIESEINDTHSIVKGEPPAAVLVFCYQRLSDLYARLAVVEAELSVA